MAISVKELVYALITGGLVVTAITIGWDLFKQPNIDIGISDPSVSERLINTTLVIKNTGILAAHNLRITINPEGIINNQTIDFSTEQYELIPNGDKSVVVLMPRLAADAEVHLAMSLRLNEKDNNLNAYVNFDEKSSKKQFTYDSSSKKFNPSIINYLSLILSGITIIITLISGIFTFRQSRLEHLLTKRVKALDIEERKLKERRTFASDLRKEVESIKSRIRSNPSNNEVLACDVWDSKSQKERSNFFVESPDLALLNNFYTELRQRNSHLLCNDKDEIVMREKNRLCLYHADVVLKDVSWREYMNP